MKIHPRSRIRNKISHLLLKWRRRLENEIREGFEESGEASLMSAIAKEYAGKKIIVFDVGANIGTWSAVLAKKIAEYDGTLELHAFEPVAQYSGPGTFNKVAVSTSKGSVIINKWKDSDQSSIYERRINQPKQGKPEQFRIQSIRLDEYIKEHNVSHVDFLKIDVEGHEISVLESLGGYLSPSFISYIQFEYGPTYIESGKFLFDAYTLLNEYRICKLFPRHLEETSYQSNLEDFMFTNYVAIGQKYEPI